ncbi:MAG: DUF4332 domain-containing protein [Planctomycetes bacterium]|nr:DUF4332 domain-containing protein [Planctomycetota bacterium]
MRISQLSLEGRGAWPDLQVDSLNSQLNVFFGDPRTGKSTIARLASHLIYGKTDSPWRKQFGQTVPLTEGTLTLEGKQGKYFLRRHRGAGTQEKLTVASADGNAIDSQTMRSLLSNLSPELASRLFVVDFAESPPVEWLLSEPFSRQFTASHAVSQKTSCSIHSGVDPSPTAVDRRRVDGLVGLRDAVAQEIEQQLALRRQESGVLQRELGEVDAALAEKQDRKNELNAQLRSIEKELADVEIRLRYFSLESATQSTPSAPDTAQHQRQLDEIEAEISRCRQALSDLNAREAVVRNELAQLTADGTADSVTCLADGRTTLNVMERLLNDLDAEVAQLARANEPGRCIGLDSHARLSPVAEMLRLQVYTLCGQLTEQERIARRQQATVESRQLARAQTDLGERLEQLLSRRESLIQKNHLVGQPVLLMPQSPVSEHCNCDRHGHFVNSAEAMQLGRRDRLQIESTAEQRRTSLERERAHLAEELATLHSDIEQLELRWKRLQSERAGLIGGVSLEENQAELERLEKLISQTLQQQTVQSAVNSTGTWRASDVLAQLTDGQLVQIHLDRHGRHATVVDCDGNPQTLEALSPSQHDAVYLALTLALVGSYASNGIQLPLILDEPFLRQDTSEAAAMAGVLEEFAQSGHQVFVFTEDKNARRRFESLGSVLYDLETIRRRPVVTPEHVATEPTQKITKTNTRIVRQSIDSQSGPSLRVVPADGESNDLFYLSETSSFDDFPILGNKTAQLFSSIGIQTVGDLLVADATEVAARLGRREIVPEAVQLWQTHMGLMCYVPEITLNDAQLLSAAGIASPEDLFDIEADFLLRMVEKFFSSGRGSQFAPSRERYSRSRLNNWIRGARRYQDRWSHSRNRFSWPRSLRTNQQDSRRQKATHSGGVSRQPSQRTSQSATLHSKRDFYLARESDVEAAPSIGPKTASRLSKVGIRTVADLLSADPDSTAEELDVSHIKPTTIANWQHQARLVCRIPQLRGLGAQLFVACGFLEPKQIKEANPNEVASKILTFCDTKKGQRILRKGDAPSREDIARWVESAAHTRPLEAA